MTFDIGVRIVAHGPIGGVSLASAMSGLFDGHVSGTTLVLLVVCLLIALGFEFVNGFHDTANAVATVIYTKTLKPSVAVIFSGLCNFLGVFVGGIAVALAIIHLLPVDLLVSSGVGRGLAMVLALLLSAITWNLATWWKGIPASSSHALIGAILGVGLASSGMEGRLGEGVNLDKALHVGASLLVSPVFGFGMAAAILWVMHRVVRDQRVFGPPRGDGPPPRWIRGLLVLTCGGVSFAHGSNDGQKGVGLIMLILIGLVPAGFALDVDASAAEIAGAREAATAMLAQVKPTATACTAEATTRGCLLERHLTTIDETLAGIERVEDIPVDERWPVREALLRIDQQLTAMAAEPSEKDLAATLETERKHIAPLTDYAPDWVIFAVALSLGVGTMIGWKRIVVTVGEKIGKAHLTYAQGAAAELVAMSTIGVSSWFGLPVSTTHVLSSGVAGAMVVEGAGVQKKTVRNIALAWVLTLPATMLLSAVFFAILSRIMS